MSIIGNTGSGYPSVPFKSIGDAVAGRIIDHEDYQCTEFGSNPPVLKFFEKSGDPVMGVRIDLEVEPGNPSSRVSLFAEKPRMLKAIATAVKGSGAPDLEIGADLAVTHTGMDGRAKAFEAAYARPEADAQAA